MTNFENDSRYRAASLGALLARHYPEATPHSIASVVFAMQRATRTAKKFAEDQCNFDLGDPDDKRSAYARRRRAQDKAEFAITERMFDAELIVPEYRSTDCRRMGINGLPEAARLNLGGDPRGPCGRLIIPGVRGDGFGDGFAIY